MVDVFGRRFATQFLPSRAVSGGVSGLGSGPRLATAPGCGPFLSVVAVRGVLSARRHGVFSFLLSFLVSIGYFSDEIEIFRESQPGIWGKNNSCIFRVNAEQTTFFLA